MGLGTVDARRKMAPPIVTSAQADLGFAYRATGRETVRVLRHGRQVSILRGKAALRFLGKVEGASAAAVQQLCARATGNYKRGNEGLAAEANEIKGRGR